MKRLLAAAVSGVVFTLAILAWIALVTGSVYTAIHAVIFIFTNINTLLDACITLAILLFVISSIHFYRSIQ